jgi:adenosine kinase
VLIITCGPEPAYVCEYNFMKECVEFFGCYSPVNVDESKIVDTNGAGDAFAGGFLSRHVKGRPIEECMKAGHWSASIIIQQRGFQIPTDINPGEISQ